MRPPAPCGRIHTVRAHCPQESEEEKMSTVWIIALFLLGLVLIVKGGDLFVDAATWIAKVLGVPQFLIGATIVSVATTLPELIVSVTAAVEGSVDMAVGNAVGSVTANLGLIMALALLFLAGPARRKDIGFQSIWMLLCAAVLVVFCYDGQLQVWQGCILLAMFAIYMWRTIRTARTSMQGDPDAEEQKQQVDRSRKATVTGIVKFVLGAAGIVGGAQLLVKYGSLLATDVLGVPESIVAVTMVAIGTSLPELVTTLTAIAKKQAGLSYGNIIGANILDLTMIMPVCAVISGSSLPVCAQSVRLDIPVCLLVGCLALVPALLRQKFARWQGVVLLVVYAVYVWAVCAMAV